MFQLDRPGQQKQSWPHYPRYVFFEQTAEELQDLLLRHETGLSAFDYWPHLRINLGYCMCPASMQSASGGLIERPLPVDKMHKDQQNSASPPFHSFFAACKAGWF